MPADGSAGFRSFAGVVVWPSGLGALTDRTLCPACFAPHSGTVCGNCGLDLNHPATDELFLASREASSSLARRVGIIGRMRFETDARAAGIATAAAASAAAPADATVAVAPPMVPAQAVPAAAVAASSVAPPTLPVGPPAPPTAATPTHPVRRPVSSVQLALLIVGVSALSVGAIFFLVYAFINFGLGWRSVIIGTITLAAVAGAELLRRRGQRTTAEGIASFAIVLVYLDAFAIRANNLFSAGAVDGNAFWGLTLVASSAAFVGWNRASTLRAPSIAGFSTFAPGVGLLAYSAASAAPESVRLGMSFAAVAAAGIVHRLAGRPATPTTVQARARTERWVALVTALAALAGASLSAVAMIWLDPELGSGGGVDAAAISGPAASATTFAAIGLIAAVHLVVLRTLPDPRPVVFGFLFAVALGVAFAVTGAVAVAVVRDSGSAAVLVPAVVAVAVALALEAGAHRVTDPFLRRSFAVACGGALVVAAIAVIGPLDKAGTAALLAVTAALADPWTLSPTDTIVEPTAALRDAILTLTAVTILGAIGWAASGLLRRRLRILGLAFAVLLVLAVPLLSNVVLISMGWLVLGVASLAALLLLARASSGVPAVSEPPTVSSALTPGLLLLLPIATTAGWMLGWASEATWAPASAAIIGLALVARALTRSAGVRAGLLGVALVLVLVAAAAAARQFGIAADLVATDDSVRLVGFTSVVALALGVIPLDRVLGALDRRTLFWISLVVAGGSAAWLQYGPASAITLLAPVPSILALSALLLAVLLLWTALPSTSAFPIERSTASVAIGPATLIVLLSIAVAIDAPELVITVAPVTAALLVSAGSLAVALMRKTRIPRKVRDLGVLLVGVPPVAVGLLARQVDSTWLVLVIAAVATLTLATSRDGVFASTSPRRYLVWVALALAAVGLWLALGDRGVTVIEPWVLPLSGALLIMALLIWRADRRAASAVFGAGSPVSGAVPTSAPAPASGAVPATGPVAASGAVPASLAAPVVALAALLVSIVPIAVVAADGPPTRALIVGGVSAALLLLGSVVVGRDSIRPYLDAAALAGAIGVIVTAVGRSAAILTDGTRRAAPGGELEAWLGFALLVLVAAGFGLSRDQLSGATGDTFAHQRLIASQALAIVAFTAVIAIEAIAIDDGPAGLLRALGVTLVFCAIHVIAFLINRVPFTQLVAWLALAYAAIAVVVGIVAGALDPLEIGTIPLALALIATGAVRLISDPDARSWPWLGPGVAVLLVLSLIATIDDTPLWRLVGIGVVGIAIVLIGAVRRLQAPFLIAVVVVLVHAIATFTPQIRAVYEFFPWWLWLAVGGIVLIGLAARYERRIQNVRGIVLQVSGLR